MNEQNIDSPNVTIVVVPRERFSCTQESLESILKFTTIPYELVYVDGGSPVHIRKYIEDQAKINHFEVIRKNFYLSPNQARNIGLREVKTKYLVFYDNDVVVTKGWLKAMVDCADQTNAEVVTPLTCQKLPIHEEIHCTGGVADIREKEVDGVKKRFFVDQIHNQGKKVKDIRALNMSQ